MKLNENAEQSLNGQEDNSTQNSNNQDWNSKGGRRTNSGIFNYNPKPSPPPSIFAMYQADLDLTDKPSWFFHYQRQKKSFAHKVKSFSYGKPIEMATLNSKLSNEFVMKHLHHVKDVEQKQKIMNYIINRNTIKLQIFSRSVLKLKNDSARRIQLRLRRLKKERESNCEIEQRVDQLQYQSSVKIIQGWMRGKLKLMKSRKSKVNPAVE